MCDTCTRLQERYNTAVGRLLSAQRDLATYAIGSQTDAFACRWNDCHAALTEIWELREKITAHASSHTTESRRALG